MKVCDNRAQAHQNCSIESSLGKIGVFVLFFFLNIGKIGLYYQNCAIIIAVLRLIHYIPSLILRQKNCNILQNKQDSPT